MSALMRHRGDDGVDELRADPGGGRRDNALRDVERAKRAGVERLHVPDELEDARQATKRAHDLIPGQPIFVVGREGALIAPIAIRSVSSIGSVRAIACATT